MIEYPIMRQPSTPHRGTHEAGNQSTRPWQMSRIFYGCLSRRKNMPRVTRCLCSLTLIVGLLFAVNPVMAADDCHPLEGTATSQLTGADTASGTASLTLGGRAFTATFTISAIVIGPPGPDGISATTSSHTFEVRRRHAAVGTFTTADQGRLVPTATPGVAVLQNSLTLVSGTGIFRGDSGVIETASILDFTSVPPAGASVLFGTICD